MEKKKCKKCGKELPLTEYYKNMLTRDGLLGNCKKCCNKYSDEYRRKRVQREKLKLMARNE